MTGKTRIRYSIILEFIIVICMCVGVYFTLGASQFLSKGYGLLYFTVQSNLWIGAICLVFAILKIIGLKTGRTDIPRWLYIIKYMFTTAVTFTFVVMALLLTPQLIRSGSTGYLASPSNIFSHYLTPILAIADFLFFDINWRSKWRDCLFTAVMPTYYLIFCLFCYRNGVVFDQNGARVPYFFLDAAKLTWFGFTKNGPGVFWWIVLLTLFGIGIGLAYIAIIRKIGKRAEESAKKVEYSVPES
jgi:hypothetical protein